MHKKQPHHPTIKVLLSSLTMLIASHTTTIQAENLIQTYELAAKSDPEWHASQEALEANKLFKKMGLSGLLPQIIGTISYSRVDSDADEVPTGISEGFGTSLGLVACVIPTLVDGTETFPAECANTSQLSPLTEFSDCIRDNGGDATSCYFSTAKTGAVDTTSTTIQLTQPLFRLDKWFDYRKSLFQVSKSVSDFESARQDFVLRVAETYFNDLKAKEEIEFSKLEERAIAYQLQTTQKRFKRGIGSSLEVYEAQSVLDINYASKLAIESFGETTHDNLVLLTRSHDIQPDPLPADIPIELPQPNSVDTWVEISRLNSSDLRSAEFAVLIAKQNYKKAKSAHGPQIDLGISYTTQDTDIESLVSSSGTSNTTTIGINLNVPLFTGGLTTAAASQAKHQQREAEFRLEQTRAQIAGSTRRLYRQVNSAVHRVEANELAIISSEKTLKATRRGFERGIRTVADVLRAQRELFRTKKEYSSARYDYILDTLRLKRISGLLDKKDLNILNTWLEVVEVNSDGSVSASKLNKSLPQTEKVKRQKRERHLAKHPQPKSLFEAIKGWKGKN